MKQHFTEALESAQGRSEFVIVAVIDIRGFSRFSTRHESPDIAMFIKRFYLRLIKDYFVDAKFVKPTGDGLLMTFTYDENTLKDVAKQVIEACLKVLVDFPAICKDDPMINFKTPDAVGVGIARGTACCLYAGEEILDYSGHLLNLASRLNDLARPSGIVIDGAFLESVIPESCQKEFKTQAVYIRSIAEEEATPVFYLQKRVKIPSSALVPIAQENWRSEHREFTHAALTKMGKLTRFNLPVRVRNADDIRIRFSYPSPLLKGSTAIVSFKEFNFVTDAVEDGVVLQMDKVLEVLKSSKVSLRKLIKFRIDFIAKV